MQKLETKFECEMGLGKFQIEKYRIDGWMGEEGNKWLVLAKLVLWLLTILLDHTFGPHL